MQPADSSLYRTAYLNTTSTFNEQLGDHYPLLNGRIYYRYSFFVKTGSPYFLTENFSPGWVVYDNKKYGNLSMLYEDLRKSVVFMNDSDQIQLVNERILSFSINGHQFIRLTPDSLHKNLPATDFYEVLYDGPSEVIKKTSKTVREVPTVEEGMTRYIKEETSYFIKSDTTFERLGSKSDLLHVFQLHKKEIESYLKKEKLKFGNNTENVLIQAAGYYDQIVSPS